MSGSPPGAGTYSGTGPVSCTFNDGLWFVNIDAEGSGLRLIGASQGSPRSISIHTGADSEGYVAWSVSEYFDGTVSFTGDAAADPPTVKVVADSASWDDRNIHIELSATCTTFFRL